MEYVVLVDSEDRPLGYKEKLAAHQSGELHRAVSIFLFNSKGQILLQQRAFDKYHSGGLWTNTCCSHPRPEEEPLDAARRRLQEEMGISCDLKKWFTFVYRAELAGGLVEHELDHVFVGRFEGEPILNPQEAAAWKWTSMDALRRDLATHPERYTAWLCKIVEDRQDLLAEFARPVEFSAERGEIIPAR